MDKEWRILIDDFKDGATNMALDEAILWAGIKGLIRPTLRLYGWRPAAVSLGYFQEPTRDIDLTRCRELSLDIVRRPTGGRAVLHEQELTYSVVAPAKVFRKPSSILEIYKEISEAMITGLSLLGIEAHMVPIQHKKGPVSVFCFSNPSAYEVAVEGKKLIGSAQRRSQRYILQQGSIIIDIDREKLEMVFPHSGPQGWANMTSINEVRQSRLDFNSLQYAIQEGFCLAWGIGFLKDGLTSYEAGVTQQLKQSKYQLPEWNLTRPNLRYDPRPA
jgi:lipoate-protein ligase A